MNSLEIWQGALVDSWNQVLTTLGGILPSIIGGILIFIVGLILAFWVKKLVIELLKILKVDRFSKSSGIDDFLKKAEVKTSFIELTGTVFEWLVILIFFLALVDILGLSVVSNVLLVVLGYVPNIFAAVLIFAAGYLLGGVVESIVRGALSSIDHEIAKPLSRLSRFLIILAAALAAIGQLKIAETFVNTFFQGLTYTMVLAVGLSVGLGAKDLVAKILDDWYTKVKKK